MKVFNIEYNDGYDNAYIIPVNGTTLDDLEEYFEDDWEGNLHPSRGVGCSIEETIEIGEDEWKLFAVDYYVVTEDGRKVAYEYYSWETLRVAVWNLPLNEKIFKEHFDRLREIKHRGERYWDEVGNWLEDTDWDTLVDLIKFGYKHGYNWR